MIVRLVEATPIDVRMPPRIAFTLLDFECEVTKWPGALIFMLGAGFTWSMFAPVPPVHSADSQLGHPLHLGHLGHLPHPGAPHRT